MGRKINNTNTKIGNNLMKVLVTGATGFIGKYVVEELLKNSDDYIIATGLEQKKEYNNERVEYISFDFNDLSSKHSNLYNLFNKPDKLIHLAWQGLPNYNQFFHIETNAFLHILFVKNLIENGLKDITITGTCFEYGMKNGCLDENTPTDPKNCYAIAKDFLRKSIEQLQREKQFDLKWIRLFYLYGDGQSPNSILSQLEKTIKNKETVFNMSGGEQLRDYMSVEKVAQNIVKIAQQNKITGIINCSSGKPISIRSLVEEYIRSKKLTMTLNLGYYPYPDYEPMAFWGDNTKLNQITNN